ncbi:hypothetical protein QQ056_10330 [Oscillatoria laete-virens NRMC-F 0139]|nr:hypothetical protein [Oscillatoria laete-virens]MDL5053941.1 hypothetical protein [Oscillatoria laete-virens NRMC-F 0139]
MRFFINDIPVPVGSVEELRRAISEHNLTGTKFQLVDTTRGVCLKAVCILHTEKETLYSLSHVENPGLVEKFAIPGEDNPGLDWILPHFESFHAGDDRWRKLSGWTETYSAKTLVLLFVGIAVIIGLYAAAKHFPL